MRGTTSKLLRIFVLDSSKTDGSGLAGLANDTSGLTWYYICEGVSAATGVTIISSVVGTWSSSGFVEVDAVHMPGVYELGIPNAALATGDSVIMMLSGAADMTPVVVEIELDAVNYQSSTEFMTSVSANVVEIDGQTTHAWQGTLASATFNTVTFPTADAYGQSIPDDTRYEWTELDIVSGTGAGQTLLLTTKTGTRTYGVLAGTMPVQCNDTSTYDLGSTWRANLAYLAGYAVSASAGVTFPTSIAPAGDTSGLAAIWDVTLADHLTSGSTGAAINTVLSSDPWTTHLPGSYTSGTAGYIVGHNVDATVSSRTTGNVTVGGYALAQDPASYILVTAANKIATSSSNAVNLNMAQVVPTSNSAQTVGDALNAARAQGFGKWVLSGTTLTLYAQDGNTPVRTFTLDSATAPTQRA